MLKTRGGNRFDGYGNVKIATERGNRAGWQLTCSECKELSDVIHRTGSSFPPKVLIRLFSEKGWKVGNNSASDVCPTCVEKRRERHREERKQYAKGSVDRLLDTIRQVDLMLASSVTVDYGPYQPQIAAQLKSLFETAYLCNMLPQAPDVPESELLRARARELEAALDKAQAEYKELQEERDQLAFESARPMPMWKPEPPPEEPPPPPPKPSPPPAPPAQEAERISPRTAAFLAEVRKQVFKGAAA